MTASARRFRERTGLAVEHRLGVRAVGSVDRWLALLRAAEGGAFAGLGLEGEFAERAAEILGASAAELGPKLAHVLFRSARQNRGWGGVGNRRAEAVARPGPLRDALAKGFPELVEVTGWDFSNASGAFVSSYGGARWSVSVKARP